jgi:ABC-type nitrate/sulfonate/bicarbonate transport system permease component
MTGIRQGVAMALVGTLIAEFFLNANGIGGLMLSASSRFDVSTVLAIIALIAILAVSLMAVGRLLESRFSTWRSEERG